MLTYLHIKNYAIVSELEGAYHNGLNIISGETGAGKSIALDALNYCLGTRADSKVVRQGAAKCDIIAHFDISALPAVQAWLESNELESENECILRRVIDKDGRSRSYINGQTNPLQLTRELAALLVHIHGQHDQQHLMRRDCQRDLLDAYATHATLLNRVSNYY